MNTPGVAADLSHISTPAKVVGYLPPDEGLKKALTGADVVVIPAGVPRKPGVRVVPFYSADSALIPNIDDQVCASTNSPHRTICLLTSWSA